MQFVLFAALGGVAHAVPQERLDQASQDGADWLTHGRDYDETRYSPLSIVNDGNVAQLGLAWSFDLQTFRGLESTPLVIDGVMYFTGDWSKVYALDARSGELLWHFDPHVPREVGWKACCDVVNRGVAAYGDSIFVGTLDGRLLALDMRTGGEQWEVQTTDPTSAQSITGAPRVMRGKVIIGNSGAEFGVRGYVSAYDVQDGHLVWRFYTVPGDPAAGFSDEVQAMAAKTWNGQWWKHGGGGTVWDSMAYDVQSNLLYIGVGNGSPHNRRVRSPGGGDNLFLSSIVALDADTGRYVWHYQETPAESWDYTASQQITIADVAWQGAKRRVLLHAPKNGFFFVIDAHSGKLLAADKYVPATWASHYDLTTGRPIENPEQDYNPETLLFPSPLGGHNWQSMAYSPATGLVYIPAQNMGAPLRANDGMRFYPRSLNPGWLASMAAPDNYLLMQSVLRKVQTGYLKAWDPIGRREKWRVEYEYAGNGGVLATAGNLVFQGEIRGEFHAYAADSGKRLWQVALPNSIVAAPISYLAGDEQYVAVLTGSGGGTLLASGVDMARSRETGKMLAFKRGGSARLAPPPPEEPIPDPPKRIDLSSAERARAKEVYMDHCFRCHGLNAVSNRQVPDLRRLPPFWHENFESVVLDGMMKDAGMPPFGDVINRREAETIHAWLIELAWQDKELRESPKWLVALKMWFYDKLADAAAWWMHRDLQPETRAEEL